MENVDVVVGRLAEVVVAAVAILFVLGSVIERAFRPA